MYAKVTIKPRGLVQLRNCPEVVADLERRAQQVAAVAGEGMKVLPAERHTSTLSGRARVAIYTSTHAARRHQSYESALARALDAAR